MSLLTIVQSACRRIGQPVPNVVATATDATVSQLFEMANEEGVELSKAGDWRVLRQEKVFLTLAQENQTNMIPTDLGYWIDETFWNRSSRRPIYGPISSQQWQAWKAFDTFPVMDVFYFRGQDILVQPVPPAGETYAFEYSSSLWCQSAGAVGQSEWMADTDTGILDERLMKLGLLWRFKQARGLAFDDDKATYDAQVQQALAQDSPRSTHSFADAADWRRLRPGIVIPEGSWPV